MPEFKRRGIIDVSAERLFAWHEAPGALERLLPPGERVRVVERQGGIREGDRTTLELKLGPLPLRWVAEHRNYEAGREFTDVQIQGPFDYWAHTHRIESLGPDRALLEDDVRYRLPGRGLGNVFAPAIQARLERMFAWRHARTALDLRRLGGAPMKIAMSGASGLLGSALTAFLKTGGHEVVPLTRKRDGSGIFWDPSRLDGEVDRASLEGFDAVIHLAGENIGAGRWTAARKAAIIDSRRVGTRVLSEALTRLASPPKALLAASAVGYYGDGMDQVFDEETRVAGRTYLAEVVQAWELATSPARQAGLRVVNMRFGVVLSPAHGALAQMLPAFRAGVGGPIGSGQQWLSWVGLDDAVGAVMHLLNHPEVSGPVNVTAPQPAQQAEFARTLGQVLGRPAFMPLPAAAVTAIFGEMGHELLLNGQRVVPSVLQASGFQFATPWLEEALRWELGEVPDSLAVAPGV
jgi:uncharacterized protein (TIGR01777 family)